MSRDGFDTQCTDFPTCPHCGKDDQDWWDGQPNRNDGDSWEVTCPFCDKDYTVTLTIDYSFSSEPVANKGEE